MYRLLHIITDTNIGGAGVLLLNQLRHFDRNRFDITILLPHGSELAPRVRALDYPVIFSRHGADASFQFGAVREYRKLIRQLSPDIVHCHGALSARIAAKQVGVPVRIFTRHCAYPPHGFVTTAPARWFYGQVTGKLSTGIVAVAKAARDDLLALGADPDAIRVIINGSEAQRRLDQDQRAEMRKKLGIGDTDIVAGMFARLEECKGHRYFLEALSRLPSDSRIRGLICGRGSLDGELRAMAERLGIGSRVIFAGFCPDIAPYMNVTQINVNCSVGTETSSLALSEGMSLGLVPVVSNYGGNGDMVRDGTDGFVIPVADPDALAEVLRRLEVDKGLLDSMNREAIRSFNERFTAVRMTRELEDFYLSQLAAVGRT
ncbi:MAG: glycosyltransferase [Eubacteriales bacterium]